MSQEARIERHLMRQRGAGPRAVKAEFGFAFPFASIDPTQGNIPLPLEPPAKRRKVAHHDGVVEPVAVDKRDVGHLATLHASAAPQPVDVSLAVKLPPGKRTRKRKLLDLDDTAESTLPPPQDDVDDSFVAGLKVVSRTTRRRKAAIDLHKTEPVKVPAIRGSRAAPRETTLGQGVPASPARSRSKRQAAVVAVEKVAMSLVEEAMPVDKLRRGVAPERPVDRSAQRRTSIAELLASPAMVPLLDARITYTAKLTASLAAAEKLSSRTEPRRRKPMARRPLRETDANIARASLSPAKGGKVLQTVGLSTSNKERNESRTKSESIRPLGESSKQLQPQLAPKRHARKGTVASQHAALGVESAAESTEEKSMQRATGPSTALAATSTSTTKAKRRVATEDDLDLLFAAESTRVKSKSLPEPCRSAKPKAAHKNSGRICKDMDLDDVLETVAALARS
ncbi:hypothetical protein B0A48_02229 [Cryoendolithus antarcticus]|uniref:Uncharacterized protein n=1 Tax=Cryoendolithus antarcticus TaxID=1507870 RepID=A0A1V8TN12_9PEZI|nr:hypothetical protein B0A48_02229 [Cryoendolithus antarcticus]